MRYANNIDRLTQRLSHTLRLTGLCAGALWLGWSCQRNPGRDVELEDMTLDVVPSFTSLDNPSNNAPSGKASFESFSPGDKVGLFLVYRGKNDAVRPLIGVHADSANMCYTANSMGFLTRILPDTPVYYNKFNPANVDLYAYYPYKTPVAAATLEKYEFTINQDQSAAAKVAASDLCWARNEQGNESVAVVPSARPVEMHFKHKLTKILLTIKTPKSLSGGRTVTKVSGTKLHGIVATTELNMSSGAISLTTDAVKKVPVAITPLAGTPTQDATWNSYPFEAIIPAQTLAANSAVVAFQVETTGASEALTLYAPSDLFGTHGLTSQPGVQYEWTITVGSTTGGGGGADGGQIEVKLDGSQIKAWQTGTAVTGDLTNSITTRFSFTNAAITSEVNRVKVTTNESVTIYDIATGVTVTGTTCSFAFTRASSSPRDYGFSITKMEFLNNNTSVYIWTGTSARVYNPTSMTL